MYPMRDLGIPHEGRRQRRRDRARPPDRRQRYADHDDADHGAQGGLKRGIATLCIGGGEATAIAVDWLSTDSAGMMRRRRCCSPKREKSDASDHLPCRRLAFCASTPPARRKPAALQHQQHDLGLRDKKEGKLGIRSTPTAITSRNTVGGKHIDHGTAVMKDGKACFTSAMTKDGEGAGRPRPGQIGHSMVTTSDKGEKLRVTRVAYVN